MNFDKLVVPQDVELSAVEQSKSEAVKAVEYAEALVVQDIESCMVAESFSAACSKSEKIIKERFAKALEKTKAAKKKAAEADKELVAMIEELAGPFSVSRRMADDKARTWRQAEQRRIDAENEKRRLEAQAKAEADRKAEVERLKQIGSPEAKQAARELKAAPVVADIVEETLAPSANGVTHRAHWKARVTSLLTLVKAAAKEPEKYLRYLGADMVALNALAVADKEQFSIPGVVAENVGSTAHR